MDSSGATTVRFFDEFSPQVFIFNSEKMIVNFSCSNMCALQSKSLIVHYASVMTYDLLFYSNLGRIFPLQTFMIRSPGVGLALRDQSFESRVTFIISTVDRVATRK